MSGEFAAGKDITLHMQSISQDTCVFGLLAIEKLPKKPIWSEVNQAEVVSGLWVGGFSRGHNSR